MYDLANVSVRTRVSVRPPIGPPRRRQRLDVRTQVCADIFLPRSSTCLKQPRQFSLAATFPTALIGLSAELRRWLRADKWGTMRQKGRTSKSANPANGGTMRQMGDNTSNAKPANLQSQKGKTRRRGKIRHREWRYLISMKSAPQCRRRMWTRKI